MEVVVGLAVKVESAHERRGVCRRHGDQSDSLLQVRPRAALHRQPIEAQVVARVQDEQPRVERVKAQADRALAFELELHT